MKHRLASLSVAALTAALAVVPANALAWGAAGHTIINRLAAESLPASLPAFVRAPAAIDEIAFLGPEEDRIKGAGESWDEDTDEGHFLDLDDNGTIAGVVAMNALPGDMADYAQALLAAKSTPYKQGFLPYTILDGFERVRKDFAYWRADAYLAVHATSDAQRAKYTAERTVREAITLHDIGLWGHYVGDGAQPLHVSVHYNGWGNYPNPKGYSTSHHVHAMFESQFVSAHVTAEAVRPHLADYTPMNPSSLLTQAQLAMQVGTFLDESAKAVPPLYDLDKAGDFEHATPAAVDFTARQLARGASMLRDLTALAWEDSLNQKVGYPGATVRDILGGRTSTDFASGD